MKVLVACERSGRVRDAFSKRGHNAWSCDLEKASGKHYCCDVLQILNNGWDLMIAHPPCTYLAVSGARWFDDPKYPNRRQQQKEAVEFVKRLWNASIPKIAIENPVGVLSTRWMKPTQIIDPLNFGHAQRKTTCLWLKNLPLLIAPSVYDLPKFEEVDHEHLSAGHYLQPSETRGYERAITFENIAWAMAEQWG